MNIFRIKASTLDGEFILATQLSEKQIRSIIQPMVDEEKDGDFVFVNNDYVQVLRDAYSKSVILTDLDDIEIIQF